MTEIEKIEAYFAEGARLWTRNPDLVLSKAFFELWEDSHHPLPFAIDCSDLSICDRKIPAHDDDNPVGYFMWDEEEQCGSLRLEGVRSTQKILATFDDGHPVFWEPEIRYADDDEISYGERLEVIYDMIAYFRTKHPLKRTESLSRRSYLEFLNDCKSRFDRPVIRLMKQLTLAAVKKLIRRAEEDMAADELSAQLVLPLDGTHMVTPVDREAAMPEAAAAAATTVISLRERTYWTILRELNFIHQTHLFLDEHEENYVLPFDELTVLEQGAGATWFVKIPLIESVSISDGDELQVWRRGDSSPCGIFNIEFFDRTYLVGILGFGNADRAGLSEINRFYAVPRRSPVHYLRMSFEALRNRYDLEKSFQTPVLNAVFGESELLTTEDDTIELNKYLALDPSQCRAIRCAAHRDNLVVIIQGPPGTGKTHVLEHTIRSFLDEGLRILMTAPSNTAVDNLCRRLLDTPVLRLGHNKNSIAPDIVASCWMRSESAIAAFKDKKRRNESLYCGTHVSVLKDDLVHADIEKNGLFDVIVFDEAGMSSILEFVLCLQFARRAVLFGDHQQLPPFPLPTPVLDRIREQRPVMRDEWTLISRSPLEWMIGRGVSPYLLQTSYRCENPRLLRFCSILFYNARVKTSENAEYYRLPFDERQQKYPAESLCFISTSRLPGNRRREQLLLAGGRPGLENAAEARIVVDVFYNLLSRYPVEEITVIAPYRRQVRRIRDALVLGDIATICGYDGDINDGWQQLVYSRISTVDSFQGGESDAVIISYVRSNAGQSIGFVDDPNRINVALTRCRREMVMVGDLEFLKTHSKNGIFTRMQRAIDRDGVIIEIDEHALDHMGSLGDHRQPALPLV